MKVPERFLGYAFSVGDVLLELSGDFSIVNCDGAINSLLNQSSEPLIGTNCLDLFVEADRTLIKQSCQTLTGDNRLGPIQVNLLKKGGGVEPMAIFLAQLPLNKNRIFMVMSKPYRLGITPTSQSSQPADVEETSRQRKDFVENLETLLEDAPEVADKLLVTVMETSDAADLTPERAQQIERYLNGFSIGGSHATRLEENKFALVHERTGASPEMEAERLSRQVSEATGLEMLSATIDARSAGLSDQDRVKALAHTLNKYAEGASGFGLEAIAEDPAALMAETAGKVAHLRDILDKGAFALVYQPIVDLQTNQIHHYEALSRFETTAGGPSTFETITFAEEVGMIADYDMAVLLRAIDKIRAMRKQMVAPQIAINVSGRSLSNAHFMEEVARLLGQGPDLIESLSLEITESAKITDLDALATQLAAIRGWGYKVYLDDFGAGVSGFQYLRALQVDALKIDGQYIKDALDSEMDRAFLKAMVSLCRELRITTVGEWIETAAHAYLLKAIGIDYGQGYYFGKPTPGMVGLKAAV